MKNDEKVILGLWIGGWTLVPMFEDPYHQEGAVNFWKWAVREICEWVYGER